MINFALLGAGRIGSLHAQNIFHHEFANLKFIFDTNQKLSASLSKKYNCISTKTASEAINSTNIDAYNLAYQNWKKILINKFNNDTDRR